MQHVPYRGLGTRCKQRCATVRWCGQREAKPISRRSKALSGDVTVKPLSIHWNRDKCTTCTSCMVVCSEYHLGVSAPFRARVRIITDRFADEYDAEYCRQCRRALCAEACPEESIQYEASVRAWIVNEETCTGCGRCVEACPFNAIRLDAHTNLALKCDLCRGLFSCVDVCPSHALTVSGRVEETDDGS